MPGSDKVNHCCKKCVRSMVAREKGRPAFSFLRVVRRDQVNQRLPRNDFVHLLEELAFARFLHAQAQIKACLFHGSMMWVAYVRHTRGGLLQSVLDALDKGSDVDEIRQSNKQMLQIRKVRLEHFGYTDQENFPSRPLK